MIHIYYLILLVLTALGSSVMTTYAPAMLARIKRLFTRKKRPIQKVYCDDLSKRIDDLEQQVNNIAEQLASRDRNRKHNIRRDVREYLQEMAEGKYDK